MNAEDIPRVPTIYDVAYCGYIVPSNVNAGDVVWTSYCGFSTALKVRIVEEYRQPEWDNAPWGNPRYNGFDKAFKVELLDRFELAQYLGTSGQGHEPDNNTFFGLNSIPYIFASEILYFCSTDSAFNLDLLNALNNPPEIFSPTRDELQAKLDGYIERCQIENQIRNEVRGIPVQTNPPDNITCPSCGEKNVSPYDRVDGEMVCRDCYYDAESCWTCGTRVSNTVEFCVQNHGWVNVCSDECAYDNLFYCNNCGEYVTVEGYYGDDECCSCHEDYSDGISDYHSCDKTYRTFGDTKKLIGIELELDGCGSFNNGEFFESVAGTFPEYAVYAEHDGSLDCGFELITAPMSYEWICDNWSRFNDAISDAASAGYDDGNTISNAGVHIHMSNEWFGDLESEREYNITKLLLIVELFWGEFSRLSRRVSNWGKRINKTNPSELEREVKKPKYNQERYQAVNLCNYNTVEFRTFNTTTDPMIMRGYIDLVVKTVEAAVNNDVKTIQSANSLFDLTGKTEAIAYLDELTTN